MAGRVRTAACAPLVRARRGLLPNDIRRLSTQSGVFGLTMLRERKMLRVSRNFTLTTMAASNISVNVNARLAAFVESRDCDQIKLLRSEFLKSPAEFLIQAEDNDKIIELMRYGSVTHAIIPLRLHEGSTSRSLYRYDMSKSEIHALVKERIEHPDTPDVSYADSWIGQVITIRPYKLSEYVKDMEYTREGFDIVRSGKPMSMTMPHGQKIIYGDGNDSGEQA